MSAPTPRPHTSQLRRIQAKIRKIGVVNHYAFKSIRDFDFRNKRGLMGEFGGQIKWKHIADAGQVSLTLQQLNAREDTYLSDYWNRYLRECRMQGIVPVPQYPNIALGKQADQSSISEESRGRTTQADAAGLLSGVITGAAQCHTSLEFQPWWSIDLGKSHFMRAGADFQPRRSA